jgi:hypothetical protein
VGVFSIRQMLFGGSFGVRPYGIVVAQGVHDHERAAAGSGLEASEYIHSSRALAYAPWRW